MAVAVRQANTGLVTCIDGTGIKMSVSKFVCFIACLAFLASVSAAVSIPPEPVRGDVFLSCPPVLALAGSCDLSLDWL